MTYSARRFLVRDRTSSSHAKVEATVGAFEDLDGYRRYLRGSYVFRNSLYGTMTGLRWPEQFALWADPDGLRELMRNDMEDLAMDPSPPLFALQMPPISSDLEGLLGMLYVVEGSSLGARILFRRAQKLGLSGSFGARHLSAQADSVERWRRVLELLESAPELDLDRLVAASETTFVAVERAFEGISHA